MLKHIIEDLAAMVALIMFLSMIAMWAAILGGY